MLCRYLCIAHRYSQRESTVGDTLELLRWNQRVPDGQEYLLRCCSSFNKDGAWFTLAASERPLLIVQADRNAKFEFVRDKSGNGTPSTRFGSLVEADLEPCSPLQMQDWLLLGRVLYEHAAGGGAAPRPSASAYRGGLITPPELDDLVLKLLNSNAEERLGGMGLLEFRRHPYFAGFDWASERVPKVMCFLFCFFDECIDRQNCVFFYYTP
jgi:hypothetical protein